MCVCLALHPLTSQRGAGERPGVCVNIYHILPLVLLLERKSILFKPWHTVSYLGSVFLYLRGATLHKPAPPGGPSDGGLHCRLVAAQHTLTLILALPLPPPTPVAFFP